MAKLFANSVLWRLIWVCTVCQLPFYGSPDYNGLSISRCHFFFFFFNFLSDSWTKYQALSGKIKNKYRFIVCWFCLKHVDGEKKKNHAKIQTGKQMELQTGYLLESLSVLEIRYKKLFKFIIYSKSISNGCRMRVVYFNFTEWKIFDFVKIILFSRHDLWVAWYKIWAK